MLQQVDRQTADKDPVLGDLQSRRGTGESEEDGESEAGSVLWVESALQNSVLSLLTWAPPCVTLSGHRAFAEVIELRQGH
jgi:hypothetical protein